jgi:magnesium transporter
MIGQVNKMLKKQKQKSIFWVDSENPTKEEARDLMQEYDLSLEVAQDILLPTFKDKIVNHKDYIYLVLHFPAFKHTHNKSHRQEIDFILGKNFIITNRYEQIDAMEKYSKIFEVNSILNKNELKTGSGEIFTAMMRTVYQSLTDELESLKYLMNDIEKNIFDGKEKEMVWELSRIGREIINFTHIINPHGEILDNLKEVGEKILGKSFILELNILINDYYKMSKTLENITEMMRELRETNNSLLSTKQNEIMKTLTIFTFFALPFSIITGLFQMNTINMPIVKNPSGWYVIVSTEIVVLIIVYFIAKKKKWF